MSQWVSGSASQRYSDTVKGKMGNGNNYMKNLFAFFCAC